jgi:hypothetical protein
VDHEPARVEPLDRSAGAGGVREPVAMRRLVAAAHSPEASRNSARLVDVRALSLEQRVDGAVELRIEPFRLYFHFTETPLFGPEAPLPPLPRCCVRLDICLSAVCDSCWHGSRQALSSIGRME